MGGGQGYSQAPQRQMGTKPQGALPPMGQAGPGYQNRVDQPVGAYQAPRNQQGAQMGAFLQALQQRMRQQRGQGQGGGMGGGYGPPPDRIPRNPMPGPTPRGLGAQTPYGNEPQGYQAGGNPMGSPQLNRWRPGLPGSGGGNPLVTPQPRPGGTSGETIPGPGQPGYTPGGLWDALNNPHPDNSWDRMPRTYTPGGWDDPNRTTGGTNTNTANPPPSGGPAGYVPASGGEEQGATFMGGRWWKPPAA